MNGLGEDFSEFVLNSLAGLRVTESPSLSELVGLRPGIISVLSPIPVFKLSADEILEGGLVFPEQPSFWRYIIVQGGQPLCFADLEVRVEAAFKAVRQFIFSPYVAGLVKALGLMNTVFSSDEELGGISIIEFSELDLRLVSKYKESSSFITIDPDPLGLGAGRVWTYPEVREIAMAAKRRLSEDDTPDCSGC